MSDVYESLAAALKGYFGKPLSALPKKLRARVEREFFGLKWYKLTVKRRRAVAVQWDNLHDPEAVARIEQPDAFLKEYEDAKAEVDKWRTKPAPTASDQAVKDDRLKAAQERFDPLDAKYKRERGDYLDESDGGPDATKRSDDPDESESGRVAPKKKRSRTDAMSAEIEAAIRILGSGWTPHLVMRELRSYAGKAATCITEAGPDYVLWRNGSRDNQKLTMKNLRGRLSHRAKSR